MECNVLKLLSKPKTKRGKRHLQEREPKVHENTKKTMFVKGGQTSALITNVLKQFVIFLHLLFYFFPKKFFIIQVFA